MSFVITTFYHFFKIDNLEEAKESLLSFCRASKLLGTILIATEGINSTISGSRENIDSFYLFLQNLFHIEFTFKESHSNIPPFEKMKVKIKPEIVTMGVGNIQVTEYNGTYISPKDWDDFISRPDVILVDTRNNYEIAMGSFHNSINPNTDNFRQFPKWAKNNLDPKSNVKIAMCCTGGIRCEKSTAYLKQEGFKEVYHLEGGILKYLEETRNENKKWYGECFVFDERTGVNDYLTPTEINYCKSCANEIRTDDVKRIKGKKSHICFDCYTKK
ncbi:MAG: rhodanese-related sulfurtransferase [Alphaproteobacteria bacterium]